MSTTMDNYKELAYEVRGLIETIRCNIGNFQIGKFVTTENFKGML